MTVLRNQNKAREEPESWIFKSFNLIEWNQIVGPVCFFNIWETFCPSPFFVNVVCGFPLKQAPFTNLIELIPLGDKWIEDDAVMEN